MTLNEFRRQVGQYLGSFCEEWKDCNEKYGDGYVPMDMDPGDWWEQLFEYEPGSIHATKVVDDEQDT